jgi:transposase InsO family protein
MTTRLAESFMKTLKLEEVDGSYYRDINVARSHIGSFIETVYNRQRLHSALNYLSPMEFEGRPFPSAVMEQQKGMASTNCP